MPDIGRGGAGWSEGRTVMPLDGDGVCPEADVAGLDWSEGKPLQLPIFELCVLFMTLKSNCWRKSVYRDQV